MRVNKFPRARWQEFSSHFIQKSTGFKLCPLTVPVSLWYYHCTRKVRGVFHCKGNSPPTAERHRWKIQWRAACFQTIVWGLFEDLHGYNFPCIAVQIKFRSTLKTSDSLERRASARLRAHSMWREQRALAKIFPVCRSFWYFFSKKYKIERKQ